MAKIPLPKNGCFTSSFPSTEWQEVPCTTAPTTPYLPARGTRSANVGNGTDVSAAFLSELLNVPAGKHDDQVDGLGLIGQVLDRMNKGTAPPDTDQKIRFMNGLTMDEAWELARPKQPDWNARI
jgi:hypothetical protein